MKRKHQDSVDDQSTKDWIGQANQGLGLSRTTEDLNGHGRQRTGLVKNDRGLGWSRTTDEFVGQGRQRNGLTTDYRGLGWSRMTEDHVVQ